MGDDCDQNTHPCSVTKQVLFTSSQPVKKKNCPFCCGDHYLIHFTVFKGPEERSVAVKAKKLWPNCLHWGHTSLKNCPSRYRCVRYHQPHYTSLHNDKITSFSNPKPSSSHTGCLQTKTDVLPFLFLKTAIADVSTHRASHSANLLIDEGSQLS
jgi:hypothetical protein